jgi:FMN phosphatase YigB (HAD superfamily)
MIKAIFIDFYGTVVHKDGEVIKQVSQEILDTGIVR